MWYANSARFCTLVISLLDSVDRAGIAPAIDDVEWHKEDVITGTCHRPSIPLFNCVSLSTPPTHCLTANEDSSDKPIAIFAPCQLLGIREIRSATEAKEQSESPEAGLSVAVVGSSSIVFSFFAAPVFGSVVNPAPC